MKFLCILYLILIILIVLTIISFIRFVHQSKNLRDIFDSMDIYLTKRWNSIPHILEYLKLDTKKNEESYLKIIEMLDIDYKNLSSEEKVEFNNEIEKHLDILVNQTLIESDINDNQLFLDIREDHIQIEKNLDNIEKYYNTIVEKYNKRVNRFPSRLVATLFSYKEKLTFNPSILNDQNYMEDEKKED